MTCDRTNCGREARHACGRCGCSICGRHRIWVRDGDEAFASCDACFLIYAGLDPELRDM